MNENANVGGTGAGQGDQVNGVGFGGFQENENGNVGGNGASQADQMVEEEQPEEVHVEDEVVQAVDGEDQMVQDPVHVEVADVAAPTGQDNGVGSGGFQDNDDADAEHVDEHVDENVNLHQDATDVYGHVLQPMAGRMDWPKAPGRQLKIKPPPYRRIPGRPVEARRKKPDEPNKDQEGSSKLSRKGQVQTCTFCRQRGHNKRACHQKDSMENQAERTETRESNPSSSVTNRFAANSTREKGKGAMSNCHQATAIGSGESADANASGSFLIGGSQPQAPSSSIHFNVSASARAPTSSQVPATATATVVAPNPSPIPAAPASFNGPKIASNIATASVARQFPVDLSKANQSRGGKRKADEVVTTQGSQASVSQGVKGKKKLFE
ncbi:hypothetical protein COLO4_09855 [Corchorus olitorius]|uniref:Uncharacterized protein n=1 Tax=Corchorus olitorius TaxID=93759 RepID=A0A1R3KAT1_9ROSI|nr:hypothetical protein COLO4_09855 [Corchorus olitorius]